MKTIILKICVAFLAMSACTVSSFAPSSNNLVLPSVARRTTVPKSTITKRINHHHCNYHASPYSLSSSSLSMMTEPSITSHLMESIQSTTTLLSSSVSPILSNSNIKKAFSLATFGPQYLWILMVLFPKTTITKKVMGNYSTILFFSLVHLFIVVASASQENGTAPLAEFNDVFNPSPDADPQAAMIGMMKYPNFVSEEWSHVLTWDLFVGRWIWLDGLRRGIFTSHSVLLTNLIGPPGFLLHCLTCIVTGKGIVGDEVPEEEEEQK